MIEQESKETTDIPANTPLTQPHFRLAVLTSHPIQYQAPLFRLLAAQPEIDLTVFFCLDWGLKEYHDSGFGRTVQWDIPLTEGYRAVFLRNFSPRPDVSRFWGLLNPAIIRHLANEKYDALLVHGWMRATNWLAMLAAFFFGVPVLLRGESHLLRKVPGWKAILKRIVLSHLFRHVTAFLAIGSYNRDFYQHYGVQSERIFLAPYAIDNEFFQHKAAEYLSHRNKIKDELGIPHDYCVILFTGKLSESKRPLDLLAAFGQLPVKLKASLIFVGDGILRAEIETQIEVWKLHHVYLVGFQNQTELPRFYAIADIFVLPSTALETWGLVVNEAMCFGLPIIVSDQVGAGGDLIHEGVNGYKFPTGDVETLTRKLKQLLTDEKLRKCMGEASRQIIDEWDLIENTRVILSCLSTLSLRTTQ